MTYEKQISEIKQKIMNLLVHNESIVAAIDNQNIVDPDDLIYSNLWYSFRIPMTETETETHICIKCNLSESRRTDVTNDLDIYFLIVTHQELMKVPRTSVARGCTRIDFIAGQIELMLNGRKDLGLKEIKLVSSVEDSTDSRHPCRVMRFRGACLNKPCR